ncbi:MAG: hypothetical protein ACO3NL_03745 [Phycisphaerales bacterium]
MRALLSLGVVIGSGFVASSLAAAPPIPDEWFFSGKDRPAELKSLEGKPAPKLETDTWIGDAVDLAGTRG